MKSCIRESELRPFCLGKRLIIKKVRNSSRGLGFEGSQGSQLASHLLENFGGHSTETGGFTGGQCFLTPAHIHFWRHFHLLMHEIGIPQLTQYVFRILSYVCLCLSFTSREVLMLPFQKLKPSLTVSWGTKH